MHTNRQHLIRYRQPLASFARPKNVGYNIEVTIDEVNLTGNDKDNYRINQSPKVKTTGIINQMHVKITGISVTPKVYDGEIWADVDYNSAVFDKLVEGDDIKPDYLYASYDNANVGTNKRVSLDYEEYCTGLAGNDKDNYILDRDGCVGETVGDIQKAPLTVKADDKSKEWGTADDSTLTLHSRLVHRTSLCQTAHTEARLW